MILRERVPLRLPRLGLLSVVLLAAATLPAWAQRAAENPTNPTAAGAGGSGAGGAAAGVSDEPAAPGLESVVRADVAPPARPQPTDVRDYLVLSRRVPTNPLPDDALQLLRQFEAQQTEARRELEQKLSHQRQDLIDGLQKLQDRYTKAGRLDEAVAVRDEIRRLRAAQPPLYGTTGSVRKSLTAPGPRPGIGSSRIRASADPGTLVEYRDRVGQVFYFDVVGATDGTIWGTEVYTDDSPLATAAVHAGVLQPGQRGVVRVHVLPALQRYGGSTANGVTSLDYGPWEGSYVVDLAPTNTTPRPPIPGSGGVRHYGGPTGSTSSTGGSTGSTGNVATDSSSSGTSAGKVGGSSRSPEPDPGTLYGYRGHNGQHFVFEVVGATDATIWGDGIYTDDSPLATAAVHAGVLEPGQRGIVRVSILPGRDSYEGSTRNGVTSLAYASFPGSYQVSPVLVPAPPSRSSKAGSSDAYGAYGAATVDRFLSGKPGESVIVQVGGSNDGPLWGTDVYTNDSSIGTAAVHAGLLKVGEKGAVLVTFLPGRDHYDGSTRNGVASQPWTTPWDGSFRLTAHPPVGDTDKLLRLGTSVAPADEGGSTEKQTEKQTEKEGQPSENSPTAPARR